MFLGFPQLSHRAMDSEAEHVLFYIFIHITLYIISNLVNIELLLSQFFVLNPVFNLASLKLFYGLNIFFFQSCKSKFQPLYILLQLFDDGIPVFFLEIISILMQNTFIAYIKVTKFTSPAKHDVINVAANKTCRSIFSLFFKNFLKLYIECRKTSQSIH